MLENPMVIGAEAAELRADWTCPHCGARWQRDTDPDGDVRYDNGVYSVSADELKGVGCCYACAMAWDSEESRRRYIRETNQSVEVMSAYLGTSAGSAIARRDLYNTLAWDSPDTLDGLLLNYLRGPRESAYRLWLMGGGGA